MVHLFTPSRGSRRLSAGPRNINSAITACFRGRRRVAQANLFMPEYPALAGGECSQRRRSIRRSIASLNSRLESSITAGELVAAGDDAPLIDNDSCRDESLDQNRERTPTRSHPCRNRPCLRLILGLSSITIAFC